MRKNRIKRVLSQFLLFFLLSGKLVLAEENARLQADSLVVGSVIEYGPGEGDRADIVRVRLIDPAGSIVEIDEFGPEGGKSAQIVSVFSACKAPKKLVIIVAWSADLPAINTGGKIYEVNIYDVRSDGGGGYVVTENTRLQKKFGSGFDGVREGERVRYKFKNAASVRQQLSRWKCQ